MLYVLYEADAGYALFEVTGFEEIDSFLPLVESSATDLNKIVKLSAFVAFDSTQEALESMNSISAGIAPDGLKSFLALKFPESDELRKNTLGVLNQNLAANISETLGIECTHDEGVVPEVLQRIRHHFSNLVKGELAKLGLGHSYSRAKVTKFNVRHVDNNMISRVALVDVFDEDIDFFMLRLRKWYSHHFPELHDIIPDNHLLYCKAIQYIGNREELTEEKLEGLEEICIDSVTARAILDAARSSTGTDIAPIDLENVLNFTHRLLRIVACRDSVHQYLKEGVITVAPNLCAFLGEQVAAKLILHAGSLIKLAKCASCTVQILGAEKARFRAWKTGSNNPPKHGIIYNTTFIGRANARNKGRIARLVAGKAVLAARIDCFRDETSADNTFGEKLRQEVEDRLTLLEECEEEEEEEEKEEEDI